MCNAYIAVINQSALYKLLMIAFLIGSKSFAHLLQTDLILTLNSSSVAKGFPDLPS